MGSIIKTIKLVLCTFFLISAQLVIAGEQVSNEFCERYANYLVRMGGSKATLYFGIERGRDISKECGVEISEAANRLQYSKESFLIDEENVTLYLYDEPVWQIKHSQISFVGGVYRVSDMEIYLVEIGIDNQYSYFSVYTSIGAALAAREEISKVANGV